MKALDWKILLQDNSVPFIERGANVKRGELNIRCPFCGSADPSYHMGLNLENGWWACWRNREHRGKSPVRLLMQLLRISFARARQLAGLSDDYVDPDGFDAVAARIMGRQQIEKVEHVRRDFLRLPTDLIDIEQSGPAWRAYSYLLHERKFTRRGVADLSRLYGLRTAYAGDWKDRIVLPYTMNGELVAWTGRAITASATIRYRDLERDECLVPIKETLYNHDAIIGGGKALVVVEGPFDALKIDLYGRDLGVRAVALSTNSVSAEQLYLLEEASFSFDWIIVMMDNKGQLGLVDSMRMKADLRSIARLRLEPVPFGAGDAGALSPQEAWDWAVETVRRIDHESVQRDDGLPLLKLPATR